MTLRPCDTAIINRRIVYNRITMQIGQNNGTPHLLTPGCLFVVPSLRYRSFTQLSKTCFTLSLYIVGLVLLVTLARNRYYGGVWRHFSVPSVTRDVSQARPFIYSNSRRTPKRTIPLITHIMVGVISAQSRPRWMLVIIVIIAWEYC